MSVHHLRWLYTSVRDRHNRNYNIFSPLNMSNATILLPTRKRQKDEATPNILRVKKPTVDYIFRHFLIIITLLCVNIIYKIMIITEGMKIFAHTIEILLNT